MTDRVVHQYLNIAFESLRRDDLMRSPGHVPADMLDTTLPVETDWVPWRPTPSTVTAADLDQLEAELGLSYPRLYRELLQTFHYLSLPEFGVRFFSHASDSWRSELENAYRYAWKPMRIVGAGLIPFGSECLLDAGPVCFDMRREGAQARLTTDTRRMVDGDCPVVFWDHEWVGTDREVSPMFSSVERMLRCLTFAAEQEEFFLFHDEDDDPGALVEKSLLLEQFFALDPEGAGGPARLYWTSFGVTPLG